MVKMNFSCPENIGEMPSTESGHFCDSCEKDIVDFSEMSNVEIQEQLKKASGKTCGIFKNRQIINASRVELSSRFRLAFMFVFMLGMSTSDMYGQDTLVTYPKTLDTAVVVDSPYVIKGQVLDADSVAVPLSKIWVEVDSAAGIPNAIFTTADLDGNYRITIPNEVKGPLSIMVRSVGYNTVNVTNVTFEPGEKMVKVNVTFTEEQELLLIGLIRICPKPLPSDPYEFGKTTLDGEDIRQWD